MQDFIITDSLQKKGKAHIEDVKIKTKESLKYIVDKHENNSTLNEIIHFCDYLFEDAFKADLNELTKIGFFPSTEAKNELEFSIKELLCGNFKCSIDHMRRAFELTFVAIFFSLGEMNAEEARGWLYSKKSTPFFSKIITALIKKERFKELNDSFQWDEEIKQHYWNLSDYVHVKGMEKGFGSFNVRLYSNTENKNLSISTHALDMVLELFIENVQHILVALYLYNPILLVGQPINEKFGLDPIIGGYYNHMQAESMKKLIPEKYKGFFLNLIKSDEEVKEITRWFKDKPDVKY